MLMSAARRLVLGAILLASAGGLAGCKPTQAERADPRTTERQVVVAQVEAATSRSRSFTGVVGARIESGLGFRVQGKVIERLVDTGQVVKRGQPLMRIDPTDYSHALVAQTGNVAAARARWIQAAADERRNRGIVSTGAVSRSEYDQAKAAADSAKALLDAALAQEKVAQNQEDYSVLLADSDGTVMQTLAEPGQVVTPGQVVVRLAYAGPREAVVNLPEMIRPAIASLATVRLFGGQTQASARLRQLSDTADPRTRTFEARYVMSGDAAAAPLGATVTVTFDQQDRNGLLSVPIGAVSDEGHGPGVWLLDAATSTVAFRPVQVQSFGAETAEIRGGVTVGQRVIAAGGHFLHEREKVRPVTITAAMQ
ncbi:efflux RND transporter periplasmic adaptor subunit [Acidisphaera rubrifaciens]|uniref:RND family efflux transporter MFP subunit n=1 Tax=Acidisphaera rubrifaciens HS-AP3 TaxID=1231350 RepID=A0A0D6P7G0_9PROT|nr:efflux RND transporter periplasmic adaptor subunit [Acidisphaera rubrifaciens]GAN77281.1 RND family efflux transporter MFP subunit [Acidisphaera rubrifaciens HS-AP3]